MVIIALSDNTYSDNLIVESKLCQLGFKRLINYTTRDKLDTEENHKEYHFVNDIQFDNLIRSDILVGWMTVDNNRYGLPKPVGSDKFVCIVDSDTVEKLRGIYGNQVVYVGHTDKESADKYDLILDINSSESSKIVEIIHFINVKGLI